MGWIDKLDTNIIIKTGDGGVYSPKWFPGEKTIEFNISKFEFIDVAGTLIKKSQPKGTIYNMILIFDGESHLEKVEAFEKSARNKNPWTIIHPYYQEILVQPSSIKIDNSKYNVSKITVSMQETIRDEFPSSEVSLSDTVKLQKIRLDNTIVNNMSSLSPQQISIQNDQIDFIGETYEELAITDEDSENLRDLINSAQADIIDGIDKPQKAMNSLISLINYPSLLSLPVKIRIDTLGKTFENLIDIADDLMLEVNGLCINSAMFEIASNPTDDDYLIASDVTTITSNLLTYNDRLLSELDSRQSDRADEVGSYVPNFYLMKDYDLLLNTSVSNLFQIAFAAKQERIFILDYDSNPISLTHRFYGMDSEDKNLNDFILQNNFGPEEIFQIKKGKEIKYYV